MKNIFTIILPLLFAVSCSSISEKIVYGQGDSGQTAVMNQGETINVVLKGNPTTGYVWEVSGIDESIVKLAGTDYVRDSDLTGAGGTYTFSFKAVNPGTAGIEIIYHRPWEKGNPPYETFKLNIQVNK